MYPSTLPDALATSPQVAIAHLRTISILTPTNLPYSHDTVSTSLYNARSNALFSLHRHVHPLLSLSSAVLTHGPAQLLTSFTSILQAIQANASLPSRLPAPPLPSYIHSYLNPLPNSAFDDVSARIAQVVSTDADELTELWNRLLPHNNSSNSHNLPGIIAYVRTETKTIQASAIALDTQIAIVRSSALTTLHNSLRNVLSALETDSAERSESPSAENIYIRLMCARGRAVAAKLKLIRAEIAASMYTPECANALRVIAREVRSKTVSIESQLMHKRLRLQQCNALGAEYLQVARDLTKARSILEHKLWARRELEAA